MAKPPFTDPLLAKIAAAARPSIDNAELHAARLRALSAWFEFDAEDAEIAIWLESLADELEGQA
jgi:hypothetical protein